MRSVSRSILPFLLLLTLGVFTACDSSPSSVDDFDIQSDVRVSTQSLTFVAGQSPAPTFTVTYQGVSAVPSLTSTGALTLTKQSETGTPQNGGEQVWSVSYDGFVEGNAVNETVDISVSRAEGSISEAVPVQVNNPVSVFDEFAPRYTSIADYEDEQRSVDVAGGASATVQQSVVAANSNGQSALEVTSPVDGSVTVQRIANLPDANIFYFLLKPDPTDAFTLTLTFTEEADGQEVAYNVDVPVEAGTEWREYAIAAGQLFSEFQPTGPQDGGNGMLQSISFTTDADVDYHLDELVFGNASESFYEIHDFEETTNAYGSFSAITIADTENVGPGSDGPTGRSMTYTEGGNFFGYNYNTLKFDGDGAVTLLIGDVSRAFNLYVFVETNGDEGGYAYGAGQEVPVEAGEDFRQVTVPLNTLGTDPSKLNDPGIRNVGFEIRRTSSDDTTEPISFVIDNIRLQD